MVKLEYRKEGRIAYLTLSRPEVRNAIDAELHRALWDAWTDFRDDPDAHVAIITGVGDAFCAGADLKDYVPNTLVNADRAFIRNALAEGLGGITRGLHRLPKPTIAAVNGWALAGGLEIALACDIRIASERAWFGSFEPRRGYHHGDGGIVRLVNTCGVGVALQLLLTAEPINAQRALQCNLVAQVVPHDELLSAAETVAQQILRNSQRAVRSAKETILDVIGRPIDDQLRLEVLNAYLSPDRDETMERLASFAARQDPGRAGRQLAPPASPASVLRP